MGVFTLYPDRDGVVETGDSIVVTWPSRSYVAKVQAFQAGRAAPSAGYRAQRGQRYAAPTGLLPWNLQAIGGTGIQHLSDNRQARLLDPLHAVVAMGRNPVWVCHGSPNDGHITLASWSAIADPLLADVRAQFPTVRVALIGIALTQGDTWDPPSGTWGDGSGGPTDANVILGTWAASRAVAWFDWHGVHPTDPNTVLAAEALYNPTSAFSNTIISRDGGVHQNDGLGNQVLGAIYDNAVFTTVYG